MSGVAFVGSKGDASEDPERRRGREVQKAKWGEGRRKRERDAGGGVDKAEEKETEEGQREKRGEVMVAINRTGTQPVDSSRVTFA